MVLGLCTGLFVTATAKANERDPALDSMVVMVLAWGAVAALGFYVGSTMQTQRGALAAHTAPRWLYALYAAVWLLGLTAAVRALIGDGGFKVAALAVVPLVLLAPTALHGIRQMAHRVPA